MKAKEIATTKHSLMHNDTKAVCTLQELQTFLLSFVDVYKGEKIEIHLHFGAETNTSNTNIYSNENSVNLRDSR